MCYFLGYFEKKISLPRENVQRGCYEQLNVFTPPRGLQWNATVLDGVRLHLITAKQCACDFFGTGGSSKGKLEREKYHAILRGHILSRLQWACVAPHLLTFWLDNSDYEAVRIPKAAEALRMADFASIFQKESAPGLFQLQL